MSETQTPPTAWMWATDSGVNGLELDAKAGLLRWYDAIGCACNDSTFDQSLTDFAERGVPGGFHQLPPDVLQEISTAVATLQP
jgi:hypothetical protein